KKFDFGRKKLRRVSSSLDNFPYDGGRNMGIFGLTDQKNGFQIIPYSRVYLGDGFFVVKIRGASQTPNQKMSADAGTKINRQACKMIYNNIIIVFEDVFEPFQPLFQRRKCFFVFVPHNGDYHPVKQWKRPVDNIRMARGDRIERSGKNGNFHRYPIWSGLQISESPSNNYRSKTEKVIFA